jgi:hypothetical protein
MIQANKGPGPDSFNGMFLKVCCDIIAFDFYKLCADLWDGTIIMQCVTSSTFVPKKIAPEIVNDYNPISFFLFCVLKVITKTLAQRLQKWILKVVHRNQYGFIEGRNIEDCLAWSFVYLH